jgi:AAA ATPase domain
LQVRCPDIIGREPEIRTLMAAFDAALHQHGGVVVLCGEAGVGKTRLTREAAAHASKSGWDVITAGDAGVTPLTIGDAVFRLPTTPRGGTGTLFILDDLELADPQTVGIVEHLADALTDQQALCVAALRRDGPSPAADRIRELHARQAITMVEVGRLSDEQVKQMALASLGTPGVPAAALSRILAPCDGLPFAVEEVLAAAVSSGELVLDQDGWHVNPQPKAKLPASIVGSVRQRLAGLSPEVIDVLSTAAVLGSQFDVSLLAGLVGVDESAVVTAMNAAAGVLLVEPPSGVEESLCFRHPLIRDAILSFLPPPERASRSRRAADAIESAHPDLPGSWCELAIEMHEAAGDVVRASELQLELGRRALQRGALASAAAVLTRARQMLEDAPSAPDRLVVDIDNAIARTMELNGDTVRLIPAAERLIADLDRIGADQRWRAHVHIRMARAFSAEQPDLAAQHLAHARAIADSVRELALSARLDSVAASCAFDAGSLDDAAALANRSLAAAEVAGLHGWAGETAYEALETIGRRAQLGGDLDTAAEAFERAYQIATVEHRPILRIRGLHQVGTVQTLKSGATTKLGQARDLAADSGAISTTALIDLELATAWSYGTDLDRALTAARSSQLAAGRIRQRRIEAMAWCVQAGIAGIRRDRDAAERSARRAELILPDDAEVHLAAWGEARVTASLLRNDVARAHTESNRAVEYGRQAWQREPRRAWGFWALLEAVAGSDGRAALDEARARGAGGSFTRAFLAYAEAVLLGREGEGHRAAALAEQASRDLEPFAPWWNHLAQRLVAPCALEHRWGQPVAWLRSAAAGLGANGYDELASACRIILRRAEPARR